MKVLLVHPGPDFSVSDVYTGWAEGLEQAGAQVRRFDLSQRLTFYGELQLGGRQLEHEKAVQLAAEGILSTAWRAIPDVVVFVSAMFVPTDVMDALRWRGARVVILHTESPYQDDQQLARAVHADLNVLNDPTHLDVFREHCAAYYQPHAWRAGVHDALGDPDPQLQADVTFVGTGFPSRVAMLEQVDWAGVELTLAGNWGGLDESSPLRKHLVHDVTECSDPQLTARLYASAGMSMNLYRREANRPDLVEGWAMGPREVELAAAGRFFAREPRGEGDQLLPMLPTFTTPGELADIVRWSIDNPGPREEAAAKARAAVADRTFHRSAARLLSELEKGTL